MPRLARNPSDTTRVLDANASVDQDLPLSYNGFLCVLRGSVRVGPDEAAIAAGQVGWLDRPAGEGSSNVRIVAADEGARVVFYVGQPQGDAITSHGPFIGDSRDDIVRLYARYRAGGFPRMIELARVRA